MEGRDGHMWIGLALSIGSLWHLYNHIKNHAIHKNYISVTWFPTSFSRYLELYLIIIACSVFSFYELHRHLWDQDGAILAVILHNVEHFFVAIPFTTHAMLSIFLDKARPKPKGFIQVSHLVVALAFAQELFLFHFHSTDHMGLEAQYHSLLRMLISVCLVTTLLSIWMPKSFMICYIRSLAVNLQGLWLIATGFMLWTPSLAPKGCSLVKDDHHTHIMVIKCDDQESLDRSKALVNLLFSCFLIGVMIFGVSLYLILNQVYGRNELIEDDVLEMEDKQGFLCDQRLPVHFEDLSYKL